MSISLEGILKEAAVYFKELICTPGIKFCPSKHMHALFIFDGRACQGIYLVSSMRFDLTWAESSQHALELRNFIQVNVQQSPQMLWKEPELYTVNYT